ncbi:hypothetical protein TNCV_4541961 [Trichonephila clavipes]|nr:hypothetical protein TNCV_4541961 [Trichonephila clavipes]
MQRRSLFGQLVGLFNSMNAAMRCDPLENDLSSSKIKGVEQSTSSSPTKGSCGRAISKYVSPILIWISFMNRSQSRRP